MIMAMPVGKMHRENIVCGMWEFVADNQDSLETHIFTCDIYLCYFEDYEIKTALVIQLQSRCSMTSQAFNMAIMKCAILSTLCSA